MKYIWIIMLVIVYALWIIATICNIIMAVKKTIRWHCDSLFEWIDSFIFNVDFYAKVCVSIHVLFLFIYSTLLYFKEV